MTVPMPDQYAPGEAYPDPAAADGQTRWGARVQDYATTADGSSRWTDGAEPAAVPPPIAGVEGPHTRPGWLTAARLDDAA